MIVHLDHEEPAAFPVAAITLRSKELRVHDPAAAAPLMLARDTVKGGSVLDGEPYVGTVDREIPAATPAEDTPIGALATALLPSATAAAPTRESTNLTQSPSNTFQASLFGRCTRRNSGWSTGSRSQRISSTQSMPRRKRQSSRVAAGESATASTTCTCLLLDASSNSSLMRWSA